MVLETPMVTEKMIEASINAVSENVDWVAALAGGSYGDAGQVMRDALKAALSTDAEPVATVAEMGAGGMRVLMPHPPGSTQRLPIGTKLYATPSTPSLAVKADRLAIAKAMCESDGANWEAATANHTANGETPEDQREYWLGKADVAISALPAAPVAKLEEKP